MVSVCADVCGVVFKSVMSVSDLPVFTNPLPRMGMHVRACCAVGGRGSKILYVPVTRKVSPTDETKSSNSHKCLAAR